MAYKMKGFSYPGEAPTKSSPAKWGGISGMGSIMDMFKRKSDRSESGSLMERLTSWRENRRNEMREKSEDARRNREAVQVEEEVKKDAYSIEGEEEEVVGNTEEEKEGKELIANEG